VLVVDASVIAPVVADTGVDGDAFRARLRGETIAGPDILRVEVMSAVRRQARTGSLTSAQADSAIEDLFDLPVSVFPTLPLLRRAWALRHSITSYDACYVALAEALGCAFLTADARLANAHGGRCAIEVI
jgi:predicted nucleic acid-binding protein